MTDDVWRRAEIQSPCVRICLIHPEAGICVGCYRTSDEIARWSGMTPAERRKIMAELPGRAPRLAHRAGGRKGKPHRRGRSSD